MELKVWGPLDCRDSQSSVTYFSYLFKWLFSLRFSSSRSRDLGHMLQETSSQIVPRSTQQESSHLERPVDYMSVGDWKYLIHEENLPGPGWCSSMDWAPACKLTGCQFDSQSGHMSGLWARFPVGGVWEVTCGYFLTYQCFPPFHTHFFPSL